MVVAEHVCLRDPGDRALSRPVTRAEIPRLGGSGGHEPRGAGMLVVSEGQGYS